VHRRTPAGGAFEIDRDGAVVAELTYRRSPTEPVIVIDHTWVTGELRNRGVAFALVHAAAEFARQEELRVVPVCSYARAEFKRDPELRALLR
jgi:predicted GNAT family acetyltransferase